MIASGEEIIKYLPQRSPMVMVTALHRSDEKSAWTSLLITAENIFVADGFLSEPGIIEHIAQSTALQAGYGFMNAGKSVPVGYIAAVKNLAIHHLPKVNETLTTQVEIINNILNVILVEAEVKVNERTVALCEMRVFIKD